jgi:hypothetical protein
MRTRRAKAGLLGFLHFPSFDFFPLSVFYFFSLSLQFPSLISFLGMFSPSFLFAINWGLGWDSAGSVHRPTVPHWQGSWQVSPRGY